MEWVWPLACVFITIIVMATLWMMLEDYCKMRVEVAEIESEYEEDPE